MDTVGTIGMTFEGFYKMAVVDAVSGQEIWRQPEWERNLILNQGMDALAWYYPPQVFEYGIAGTGTRVNSQQGGESSGSAIGGWFYLFPIGSGMQDLDTTTYGGWTGGILDVGDIIRFADGTDVRVTNVSNYSASIQETFTVSSQSFSVWKTSQTGLQNETRRCSRLSSEILNSSYYIGTDPTFGTGCGTTTSSYHRMRHWRIFDFASESASPVAYTEVGVGWDADNSPSQSTFSRIRLTGSVTVGTSQRLRLIYQLNVCYSPESESMSNNVSMSGWNPVGTTESIQNLVGTNEASYKWYSYISPNNGQSISSQAVIDPPSSGWVCAFWASTNSQSLIQLGTGRPTTRATNSFGASAITSSFLDSYELGSYQRTKYATFSQRQMNYTAIRTLGFGNDVDGVASADNSNGQVYAVLMNESRSKYDTQTLTVRYLWRWKRVLTV